jgi:hypothetical protein
VPDLPNVTVKNALLLSLKTSAMFNLSPLTLRHALDD